MTIRAAVPCIQSYERLRLIRMQVNMHFVLPPDRTLDVDQDNIFQNSHIGRPKTKQKTHTQSTKVWLTY